VPVPSLERLRTIALLALSGGAVGSAGLMYHAAHRVQAPRLLLAIFTLWVLSPFGLLALADKLSRRWGWSCLTRRTLYVVILVIAVVSLIIYGVAALGDSRPKTPPFVLLAPASCLVAAVAVATAALRSRRRSASAT
jgi:peptidoglycan/LPS O-acetylase OafA/YrhL